MQRFVTGLLVVCVLLAAGLGLTAVLSHRAARSAAQDVLYTRASELAASFISSARFAAAFRDTARLQALAAEMASDELSIAVLESDGTVSVGAGGGATGPRPGQRIVPGVELFQELRTHGQHQRFTPGARLEHWRPIAPLALRDRPGWGRRWWQKLGPPPDEPAAGGADGGLGARPPAGWLPARFSAMRLLRVTVAAELAEPLLAPARLTLSLAGATALALLGLGLLLHRAARRAQRAESELHRRRALAALGEMAAVLAHEIRTPLASIKGNAQLIGEGAPEDERASSIVEESARLERLVNGMLDYARPVAPRREPCDPDQLIERAAGLVASRAASAGVAIVTDPARCGSCLRADADQVLQVLVNLLVNAIESTASLPPDSPRAPVVIRARRSSGELVLTVQDGGAGLPEGDPEQIFRPFFSGKRQGTGLGLSVARQIVEQHGGALEVRPRKEGGVLATATLPEGRP